MVRIEEHIIKMNNTKKYIKNSKGRKRFELIKYYHKLNKELLQCKKYMKV